MLLDKQGEQNCIKYDWLQAKMHFLYFFIDLFMLQKLRQASLLYYP